MCAGSPPAAPDFKGAAEATAAGNRVDQYTPFGSQVYSPVGSTGGGGTLAAAGGGGGGYYGDNAIARTVAQTAAGAQSTGGGGDPNDPNTRWRLDTTLNPLAQDALNSQLGLSRDMGNLATAQGQRVKDQGPMDLSSVQDIADKSYQAQTSRLDPAWQQRDEQNRARLANQGLASGGEAYGNEMRDFNQGRNDAYQQANLAAIATMPQTYQLAQSSYDQPLNRLNALRTGAQVQTPQFGGTGPGANYAGAATQGGQYATGLYNADVSTANSQQAGMAAIIAAMI